MSSATEGPKKARRLTPDPAMGGAPVEGRLVSRSTGSSRWVIVRRAGTEIPVVPVVGSTKHVGRLAVWLVDDEGNATFAMASRSDLPSAASVRRSRDAKARQPRKAGERTSKTKGRRGGRPFEAALVHAAGRWRLERPSGSHVDVEVDQRTIDRWANRTIYWTVEKGRARPVRQSVTRSAGLPGLGRRSR